MGKINVKDFTIYKDITGTMTALACVENVSITINSEVIEYLCKGNGGVKNREYGTLDATGSVSGLLANDDPAGTGAFDLIDHVQNREKVTVRFGTAATGDKTVTFSAVLTPVTLDSQQGGDALVTFSADFASDGAITIATNA